MKTVLSLLSVMVMIGLTFTSCTERPERIRLIQAIQSSNTNIIVALAKQGADLSSPDRTGPRNTPLIWALFEEEFEIANVLLKLGADPNTKNRDGQTVLMRAVMGGDDNLELVQLLIQNGADVNAKDNHRASALAYARSDPPKPKIIEILRKAGAK